MVHLVRGRLIRQGLVPRVDNGLVQAGVAGAGIVALLATVVGLDYEGV